MGGSTSRRTGSGSRTTGASRSAGPVHRRVRVRRRGGVVPGLQDARCGDVRGAGGVLHGGREGGREAGRAGRQEEGEEVKCAPSGSSFFLFSSSAFRSVSRFS